ncbi:MAG TPA: hypothetical protein VNJ11_03775 [Bryobacteraceae bacterium]|nr:hypothetical protein [Bryobacteraceae bacterium]
MSGVAAAVPLLWVLCLAIPSEGETLRFRRIFEGPNRWLCGLVQVNSGTLCAVDSNYNEVVCFDKRGSNVVRFGGAGQGPGRMQYPASIALAGHDTMLVLDMDNFRVQLFRPDGSYISEFRFGFVSDAMAVIDKNTVVLNGPSEGAIAIKYSLDGRRLGRLGELVPSTLGYPDRPLKGPVAAMNRAYFASTKDRGLVVAFQFMPLVQVLNADGTLRWRRRLTGPSVEELTRVFWRDPGAPRAKSSKRIDGVQFARVITCVNVTPSQHILVGMANRTIVVLNKKGEQVGLLDCRRAVTLEPQALFHDGKFLYVAPPGEVLVTEEPLWLK